MVACLLARTAWFPSLYFSPPPSPAVYQTKSPGSPVSSLVTAGRPRHAFRRRRRTELVVESPVARRFSRQVSSAARHDYIEDSTMFVNNICTMYHHNTGGTPPARHREARSRRRKELGQPPSDDCRRKDGRIECSGSSNRSPARPTPPRRLSRAKDEQVSHVRRPVTSRLPAAVAPSRRRLSTSSCRCNARQRTRTSNTTTQCTMGHKTRPATGQQNTTFDVVGIESRQVTGK